MVVTLKTSITVYSFEELYDEIQTTNLSAVTKLTIDDSTCPCCIKEDSDDRHIPDSFCKNITELDIVSVYPIRYDFIKRCVNLKSIIITGEGLDISRLTLNNCERLTIIRLMYLPDGYTFPSVKYLHIQYMYNEHIKENFIDKLISMFPEIEELSLMLYFHICREFSFSKAKHLRQLEIEAKEINGLDIEDNNIKTLTLIVRDVYEGISKSDTVKNFKCSPNLIPIKTNFPSLGTFEVIES